MARLRPTTEQREQQAFGSWVRGRLAERRETQSVLAVILGVSQQAISAKLSGKSEITLSDMALICEHFGQQYQIGAQR